ncbi:MAG: DUF4279 domain-containing protein [Tannerella sp.]|jgi:hypothetical protein|nr:DUF4279 domain-containing protein [Tannerella sp.]
MQKNDLPIQDEYFPLIRIKFQLTGDKFDIDNVTKQLGLQPSRTRKKEEWPISTINAGLAGDLWQLNTICVTSKCVNEQFKILLNNLYGKENIINKLCKEYDLSTQFEVVIHAVETNSPAIVLDKDVIKFLASIDSDVGFDLYIYPEEE